MQLRALPMFCAADVLSVVIRLFTYCLHRQCSPISAMQLIAAERWQVSASTVSQASLMKRLERGVLVRWVLFFVGALPSFVKLFAFRGVPWTQSYGAAYCASFLLVEVLLAATQRRTTLLPSLAEAPVGVHGESTELPILNHVGSSSNPASYSQTMHSGHTGPVPPPTATSNDVTQLLGPGRVSLENIEQARRRHRYQHRSRHGHARVMAWLKSFDSLLLIFAGAMHVGMIVFAWIQLSRIQEFASRGGYGQCRLVPQVVLMPILFGEMGRWDGRKGQMWTGYCVGATTLGVTLITGWTLVVDTSMAFYYGSPSLMVFIYLMYQGLFIVIANALYYKLPRVAREMLLEPGNLPETQDTAPRISTYRTIEETFAAVTTSPLVFASFITPLLWYAYRYDPTGTENPMWTGVFG